MSVTFVIATVAVAGLAGGVGGALASDEFVSTRTGPDGTPQIVNGRKVLVTNWWAFRKRVVLGLLAAFVVPLFLVLAAPLQEKSIVSELMLEKCVNFGDEHCTNVNVWWNNLLVLVGFCVISAFVAQNFLESVAERLLREAKEKAADAMAQAETAESQSKLALETVRNSGPRQGLEKNQIAVLKAFLDVPVLPAESRALAEKAGMSGDETKEVLDDLRESGFVSRDSATKSWDLDTWGRLRLREEVGLRSDEIETLASIRQDPQRRPTPAALAERTATSQDAVLKRLERLKRMGLVAESKTEHGGWRVRSWGRLALAEAGR